MRCHSHALTTVMRFQITIVVLMLCVLSALARVCGLCPTHKLIRFLCFHFGHRRLALLSTFVGTFVIKPKRPVTPAGLCFWHSSVYSRVYPQFERGVGECAASL